MNNHEQQRLQEEVQRLRSAITELTVLNDLAIAASTSSEVDEMLDIIVKKTVKAVKAEQGAIQLVTPDKDTPLQTLIRQKDRESRVLTYKVGTSITGWVLLHQQPLKIDNLSEDTRFSPSEQERQDIKSVLCVPIRFKAELIGLLTVTNKHQGAAFDDGDLRLISIIAAQSGQLIRNSQLQAEALEKKRMQRELELARKIQDKLLPKGVPATKALNIASFFKAADEVSGDYFDYFDLGEERIGIGIADVSGHGVAPALMMSMLKGVLHAILKKFQSPSQVLTEMNAVLGKTMPWDMFATMAFLVFDLKKNVLTLSNAGHNPLLIYVHKKQACEALVFKGMALGLTPKAQFEETEIALEPEDTFVLYTDGITESFSDTQEMFEEARLIKAVEEVGHLDATAIVEHIKGQVQQFTGAAAQSDDMALIVVKIKRQDLT